MQHVARSDFRCSRKGREHIKVEAMAHGSAAVVILTPLSPVEMPPWRFLVDEARSSWVDTKRTRENRSGVMMRWGRWYRKRVLMVVENLSSMENQNTVGIETGI